jgi:hypothetical protein
MGEGDKETVEWSRWEMVIRKHEGEAEIKLDDQIFVRVGIGYV